MRVTIDQITVENRADMQNLLKVADSGFRRIRPRFVDYDYRANILRIAQEGEADGKSIKWREDRDRICADLKRQFGEADFETKLANFIDLGARNCSAVSYHNRFYIQCRSAFVGMNYYPALTGACALGERILNHLLIDLREYYKSTPEYKKVYNKNSFDRWELPIEVLLSWKVLRPEAAQEFTKLAKLRNRSIHFNLETYKNARADALEANKLLGAIIDLQFGSFGPHPWFIKGTQGVSIIRKDWESSPFIKEFYLPSSDFVGPYVSAINVDGQMRMLDHWDYGDGGFSDEEYCAALNNPDPAKLAAVTA